jgi:ATP-dependent DNA helicase RecQ
MKFSAGYANTNNNFAIINLKRQKEVDKQHLQTICVIQNILQRGTPTLPSDYIIRQLNLDTFKSNQNFIPLLSKEQPDWSSSIKGSPDGDNPALEFFESTDKIFSEYPFIKSQILPEALITEILPDVSDEFKARQVDFYIPQAKLVIEIDGSQHQLEGATDHKRNIHFKKNEIETIRIKTTDFKKQTPIFKNQIEEIKNRLSLSEQLKKYQYPDYSKAKTEIQLTKICRFQTLILQLLKFGYLSISDSEWKLRITKEQQPNFQIAFEDLFIWIENLQTLRNISFSKPQLNFTSTEGINIDFDIFKRYDDNCKNENTIFVRTDYFDENNYFTVSTTDPIEYNLKEKEAEINLRFFLKNIFQKKEFRQGQIPIITNALNRIDTIGLLPTGAGKSLCYQLVTLLQPGICFVISPLKSLMLDQKLNLDAQQISNTAFIFSGELSATEKEITQSNFSKGKYLIIWLSPERLQIKTFRKELSTVNAHCKINYAVIDEVHCLSEWGHDFRTSYLNLAKTVKEFCPNTNFLGLTATASSRVHKDIKAEFGIKDENIKSQIDFNRPELTFKVIKCPSKKKFENTKKIIEEFHIKTKFLTAPKEKSKSAIIFTPNVTWDYGCFDLSNRLNSNYPNKVNFYSGEVPKVKNKKGDKVNWTPPGEFKSYEDYKKLVQTSFKEDVFPILTSTKAFGMGIDKPNINLTIHYGLSASIESTYQEAGRAGRHEEKETKAKSDCYILFSDEAPDFPTHILENKDTTVEEISNLLSDKGFNGNDICRMLYFYTVNFRGLQNEYESIESLLKDYYQPEKSIEVGYTEFNKQHIENAIYRLSLLGVVSDYTVDFRDNKFCIDFKTVTDKILIQNLESYIKKYNEKIDIRKELNAIAEKQVSKKCIRFLLKWIYENIAYERRQALKGIAELCRNYDESNPDESSKTFKKNLVSYFEINDVTIILQHIADNPDDFPKWFEVFYKKMRKADNTVHNLGRIDKEEFIVLKFKLQRFLESYRDNTGLNLISGFLRLVLGEYDDQDGKPRLESALKQISQFQKEIQFEILKNLFDARKLDKEQRNELSNSILNYLSEDFADLIYENLGDSRSLNLLLQKPLAELKQLNEEIYGKY